MLNHKIFLFFFQTPDINEWQSMFTQIQNFAWGIIISIVLIIVALKLFKLGKWIRQKRGR